MSRSESDPAGPLSAALAAHDAGNSAMLVTVVGVQGSSPREVGARMAVTPGTTAGSIGGGMLEHMAIQRARTLLESRDDRPSLLSFPLAPETEQCCGGVVVLLLESVANMPSAALRAMLQATTSYNVATLLGTDNKVVWTKTPPREVPIPRDWPAGVAADARLVRRGDDEWLLEYRPDHRFDVALFGAGHVGRALVRVLADLPCRVRWFDSREHEFPPSLPPNVTVATKVDPTVVATLPAGCRMLVMTHRHSLDYALCEAALQRVDLPFIGLIGSVTKRRRFEKAFGRAGLDSSETSRLVCPIGLPSIRGKEPAVIAVAVAAQLLEQSGAAVQARPRRSGVGEAEADASRFAGVF